jgi:hypothetical protein
LVFNFQFWQFPGPPESPLLAYWGEISAILAIAYGLGLVSKSQSVAFVFIRGMVLLFLIRVYLRKSAVNINAAR